MVQVVQTTIVRMLGGFARRGAAKAATLRCANNSGWWFVRFEAQRRFGFRCEGVVMREGETEWWSSVALCYFGDG